MLVIAPEIIKTLVPICLDSSSIFVKVVLPIVSDLVGAKLSSRLGLELGVFEGETVDDGDLLGVELGVAEGVNDGVAEGVNDGVVLGVVVSSMEVPSTDIAYTSTLGDEDGVELGVELGVALGVELGVELGVPEGVVDGVVLGVTLTVVLGVMLGVELGTTKSTDNMKSAISNSLPSRDFVEIISLGKVWSSIAFVY